MIYGSFHIFNYLDWDHFILNQVLVFSVFVNDYFDFIRIKNY